MPAPGIVTIERHIVEQERRYPGATGELSDLLYQIALVAKIISRSVRRAGLLNILGATGEINVQDEEVMKLDELALQTMINAFDHSGAICVMASEETPDIIPIPAEFEVGKYTLAFDPLDGSSNIDANVNVGTIFSVHRRVTRGGRGTTNDLLQAGRKQVVAGYVMYGSSTMLVYSTGQGVHGFTLDPTVGEFLLSHENIRIPPKGKIYSINTGNCRFWTEGVKKYVEHLEEEDKATDRPYTMRYIGSLVADFHRTMLYGGIFMYPKDLKNPKKPAGKLRLLYEAAPLAMIAEQAGGRASDGEMNILDIMPNDLHQRVPLFIGSKEDVDQAEEFIQKYG
ncbi:MAG: class 1 fructose-bisphosphatase [Calditrichaeota bacterium]|nr:class 1 fructose-bisphosphatase [Calditrichota bacterium]